MPISSIPIRRISGLTPANVYVRHAASHGLDSIAMSIPNEVPITPEGLEAVRREHEELTTKRRPGIVAKIKAARELGDLSENFEYHAAKNEQGMMEARVRDLEAIIKNHVIIEYLTGFFANPHERLMGLAISRQGATLIVPALERQNAVEHASGAAVVAWRDGEDPYELVGRAIGRRAEIGIEREHLTVHVAEVITTRTGIGELVDVGGEIRRMRLIKNEEEIEKLARAAAITDEVTERILPQLRAGQSEV